MFHPRIHINAIRNRKTHRNNSKSIRLGKIQSKNLSCHENFHDYLENTTLHGLRYVSDRSLSFCERYIVCIICKNICFTNIILIFRRIFFALAFLVVILLSIYFISNVWAKWTLSPIIITLNARSKAISDIPFPGRLFGHWFLLQHIQTVSYINFAIFSFSGDYLQYEPGQEECCSKVSLW